MILHLLDMPRRTGPATRGGPPEAWDKESVTRRQIGLLGDRQRLGIAGVALDVGRLDIDLTWASGSAPANTLHGRSMFNCRPDYGASPGLLIASVNRPIEMLSFAGGSASHNRV